MDNVYWQVSNTNTNTNSIHGIGIGIGIGIPQGVLSTMVLEYHGTPVPGTYFYQYESIRAHIHINW